MTHFPAWLLRNLILGALIFAAVLLWQWLAQI